MLKVWGKANKGRRTLVAAFALCFSAAAFANLPENMASTEKPRELKDVGIEEKLGVTLNLDEMVTDENGVTRPLRSFFNPHQPVILSPIYFNCPGLCNFHMNGLIETLKDVDWSPGQKFQVLAFSFDSHEKPAVAYPKKANYMKVYNRPGTEGGFHFLTADEGTVQRLMTQIGFKFKWSEATKEWAHASAAIMITPDGKIARYLHGIMFDAPTVKMALNEAGGGKVGSFVDKMIWYCFHYDPRQSKYTLYAFRLVQLGGILTVIALGFLLVPMWLRSRRPSA